MITHLPQILNQIYIYYLHLPMPLELAMVLEFVKSQWTKPKLKHEGYLYCLLREKDGLKTWRWDKRQCKAIATTFNDNVLTTREHLHEPDMKQSEQLKVLEKMKEKAANSNRTNQMLSGILRRNLAWKSWSSWQ